MVESWSVAEISSNDEEEDSNPETQEAFEKALMCLMAVDEAQPDRTTSEEGNEVVIFGNSCYKDLLDDFEKLIHEYKSLDEKCANQKKELEKLKNKEGKPSCDEAEVGATVESMKIAVKKVFQIDNKTGLSYANSSNHNFQKGNLQQSSQKNVKPHSHQRDYKTNFKEAFTEKILRDMFTESSLQIQCFKGLEISNFIEVVLMMCTIKDVTHVFNLVTFQVVTNIFRT